MRHRRPALLVVPLLVVCLAGCDDYVESRFADRAAALADGAVERGAVPGFLPASAAEIQQAEDPHGHATWTEFRFAESDRALLESACRPADPADVPFPAAVWWWPEDLRDQALAGEVTVFHCPDSPDPWSEGSAYLALHAERPQAWFWRR